MYLEIFLWSRKYQKWIKFFFRLLFWSNNGNRFNLHKHVGKRKQSVITKGSGKFEKEKKQQLANIITSTSAGLSFFFLEVFSLSAAVLSPSRSYNFASTNCCNEGKQDKKNSLSDI